MERPVRHVSLHHVGETELRVVSDVDDGVTPIVQVEEEVIRGYAARARRSARCVSLFILRDLQPLLRRIPLGTKLPMLDVAGLADRPVVNVYDLADPDTCHVFVNQESMQRAGYWADPLAIRGLLAHEHAHPLAENDATRASRGLTAELAWRTQQPLTPAVASAPGRSRPATSRATATLEPRSYLKASQDEWRTRVDHLLAALVDKLCVSAPREIFANELAIRSDFEQALLHLNRQSIDTAARGLEARRALLAQLEEAVGRGDLSRSGLGLLVLIGDLRGHLEMALEVAPFLRAGRAAAAAELEAALWSAVFRALRPETLTAYEALRDRYVALSADASADQLLEWSLGHARILADALRGAGLELTCQMKLAA